MDKIVVIEGVEVGFRANALTPRLYRHKIGRDLVQDLNTLSRNFAKAVKGSNAQPPVEPSQDADKETKAQYRLDLEKYEESVRDAQLSVLDLEIFENVAFVMARQYDPSIPNEPEQWLERFSIFSIYEILPVILEIWCAQQQTTSTPKNG